MTFKLVVISDIHYGAEPMSPHREGRFGDILLSRAVHRINRMIQPDAVAVLGDCIDLPDSTQSMARLKRLRHILDQLLCPTIVIPGNHDLPSSQFYSVMPQPADFLDIGKVRLVPLVDAEEPDCNARRSDTDLQRLRAARQGHDGPIITLQHVPVLPPGTTACPFGYTNIEAVLKAMSDAGVSLSVGGHYHVGTGMVNHDNCRFLCVRSLCDIPFVFTVIVMDDVECHVEEQRLSMPSDLGLIDYHSHTQFAYCAGDINMEWSPQLAKLYGLSGLAMTEHSGQLYFEGETYWNGRFSASGIATTEGRLNRMGDYWSALQHMGDGIIVGLEADADFQGNLVIEEQDRSRADVLLGAVHFLPDTVGPDAKRNPKHLAEQFMVVMQRLVTTGIDAVAHPFRIFRRAGLEPPQELYEPIVRLLKKHGVAAEINFHTNEPDPDFFRLCLDAGVRLTFGSDAHDLHAIGEFTPHLQLLRNCGYDGDLADIIVTEASPIR